MYFASDNAGPAHPEVIAAIAADNEGYALPYGADPRMDEVREHLRAIFEAPEAAVYLVATGTAANALALATLTQPFQTVFCAGAAHIHEDECNAPEFFTGGAKLTLVDEDRMTPEGLRAAIEKEGNRGVHGPQRGPVALTQVTERGTLYSLADIQALCGIAQEYNLPVHLDGARFANALVALNSSPADMTWRAGVDALSFGGTKNGCVGVEAVIFFDPAKAWEFELRRKRGAHLFSKHRYLSAQLAAYLRDDLWLRSARSANANAALLADRLRAKGARFAWEPQANMLFPLLPRAAHQKLLAGGGVYIVMGDAETGDPDELLPSRMVCDWSISAEAIDQFVSLL